MNLDLKMQRKIYQGLAPIMTVKKIIGINALITSFSLIYDRILIIIIDSQMISNP